jgi:hypothetical protein
LTTSAADSYATAGQFDTVTSSAFGTANDTNVITITSGVTSATITAATSVNIGVTTVTAGAFLWVAASGSAAQANQAATLYQDSNSDGIIGATDLRIDFAVTGDDTQGVAIVGNKAVITVTGV